MSNYTTTQNGEIAIATSRYPYAEALPVIMGGGIVRQLAREVADTIIHEARTLHGPVVWITGNAYVPPLRSITSAELVWNAANNSDGELFAWFGEMVEAHLAEAEVAMECPEYDNALYAVDLKRWQYRDDDDVYDGTAEYDDLNDEWEPRDS
jgi:hypothetical protein